MTNTMFGWTGLSIFQIENFGPAFGNIQAFHTSQGVGFVWGMANSLVLAVNGAVNLPSTLNTLAGSLGSLVAVTTNGTQMVIAGGVALQSVAAVAADASMLVSGSLGFFPAATQISDKMFSLMEGKPSGDMLTRIQEAKSQFRSNRTFRNWAHKYYMEEMKMGNGQIRNPYLPDEMILEAYELRLELGQPAL